MSTPKKPQDDRNLVEVTPETPQPSDEERLALFWNASKGYVIVAAVVFIVAVIGNQAISATRASAQESQSAAYLDALHSESLSSFAEEEANSPLGGFAFLKIGDEAYASGDFAAAITAYEEAASTLADTPLNGRAELGLAFAQARNGNTSGATTIFAQLKTEDYPEVLRGEAAYALAVLALESEDDAAFETETAYLLGLETGQQWIARLQAIAPGRV